jgi:hypothetical protein
MGVDTIHVRCGTIPCMKRAWWWWGNLSAVGLGIIALPDLGPPFSSRRARDTAPRSWT